MTPSPEFLTAIQDLGHDVLTWVGFGTLVGLLAKAIMPGKDPGGAIATLVMGISGSVVGSGILMLIWNGERVSPISPVGFIVATGGAFSLLLFNRMFGGYFFVEGGTGRNYVAPGPNYRRRRGRTREIIYDE